VHVVDKRYFTALCHICRDEMTPINMEIAPGQHIFVCATCLASAKQNLIWVCMHCGAAYIEPKSLLLKSLSDQGLVEEYRECAAKPIIQGIERCSECDGDGTAEHMPEEKNVQYTGHC
jgi:hypothetical protein